MRARETRRTSLKALTVVDPLLEGRVAGVPRGVPGIKSGVARLLVGGAPGVHRVVPDGGDVVQLVRRLRARRHPTVLRLRVRAERLVVLAAVRHTATTPAAAAATALVAAAAATALHLAVVLHLLEGGRERERRGRRVSDGRVERSERRLAFPSKTIKHDNAVSCMIHISKSKQI